MTSAPEEALFEALAFTVMHPRKFQDTPGAVIQKMPDGMRCALRQLTSDQARSLRFLALEQPSAERRLSEAKMAFDKKLLGGS